ncbi:HAMP domain-containing sensor histidine kinase [Sphaerisporangium perillae]|uniref:HAMP domain-containing sensor histidine kinase n=1 Tax=Sphaerisporangium perillae TaxID=2935860 RepID=UPI00200BF480|nr:HAMP domain-containing sensor histidine kinase [Sphaerisporangium perillae]
MWRFGLRARTAASYVLVTAAAVLIVEAVLLGFVISSASGLDLFARLQNQAGKDAKIMSATATKLSMISPSLDQRTLLSVAMKSSSSETGFGGSAGTGAQEVPVTLVRGKTMDVPVEVLLDTDGQILTSTSIDSYPAGARLVDTLPWGGPGRGGEGTTPGGLASWWISPILVPAAGGLPATQKVPDGVAPTAGGRESAEPGATKGSGKGDKGLRTVGYIYLQAPADFPVMASFADSATPLLAPGALVLALVVPVGLVFGMLSTRRLTGRITRLAEVTTAVAGGDFAPRVTVSGRDEVSLLEDGFNRMTGQLGAAVEAIRLSARADARHTERSRIARELHDSISQDLFSLSLLAAGMRRAAPKELRREAETMERTAARTMREMQALLLELRPVALEDAGLVPAVEELCHAYETRLGITVRTSLEEVPLTPPAEHAVLRLTQEALGNAIKHAEPQSIDVRLSRTGQEVDVRIADDGRGFDPSCAPLSHGMGLGLMRERVEELGGRFSVTSEPGAGTVVSASLPIAPSAHAASLPLAPSAHAAPSAQAAPSALEPAPSARRAAPALPAGTPPAEDLRPVEAS